MGDDIFMEEERARGGERRSTEAFEPEVLRVCEGFVVVVVVVADLVRSLRAFRAREGDRFKSGSMMMMMMITRRETEGTCRTSHGRSRTTGGGRVSRGL
jgi:hypothetical protein